MAERRRPRSVTLLAAVVLILAGFHLLRFVSSLVVWENLSFLPFSRLYLTVSGLVWGIAFLILTWGIWRGTNWAPRLTWILLLAYTLAWWLDRLFLAGYPGRNENWMFAAGVNLGCLLLVYWILSRPGARQFFGEMHE